MLRIKSKFSLRLTGWGGGGGGEGVVGVRRLNSTQGGYTQIFYNDLERNLLFSVAVHFNAKRIL